MLEPLAIVPLMIFLSSWVDPLWFVAFYLGSSVAWIAVAAVALRQAAPRAAGSGDHRTGSRIPGDDDPRDCQSDLATAGYPLQMGVTDATSVEPECPAPIGALTGEGSNA